MALALAAACSDELEGGAGCPSLCPVTNAPVQDTTLDPVVLDTALAGVPVPGDASVLLLALRPGADSLDVRAVVRFDSVPGSYAPPAGGDSLPITAVTGTAIRLTLDTAGTRFFGPVTIEAYDVDTVTANDTSTALLASLFRPDRVLGSVTLDTSRVAGDTVTVPLSDVAFVAKAQARTRLRVGLRLTGARPARVRVFGAGAGLLTSIAPTIRFDPATDTIVRPVLLAASSVTPGSPQLSAAYRSQTVVARSPAASVGSDLVIGGLPARRTYLRFDVPARFTDSVDVVRAALVLTQRPSLNVDALDSAVVVRPFLVLATSDVTDLVRASELASATLGLDTVRVVSAGSGVREFQVASLLRAWRGLASNVPRAVVLRSGAEGAQTAEARFYSVEAPVGQRPRLRLSYIPRTNFGLP